MLLKTLHETVVGDTEGIIFLPRKSRVGVRNFMDRLPQHFQTEVREREGDLIFEIHLRFEAVDSRGRSIG